MPTVHFTTHLRRIAPTEPIETAGTTVMAALQQVFARFPRLHGYILDDQERLRRHVAVFVDGERLPGDDPRRMAVRPGAEIHVLQALSGG
jgi:sulfur carrier protein ThiS